MDDKKISIFNAAGTNSGLSLFYVSSVFCVPKDLVADEPENCAVLRARNVGQCPVNSETIICMCSACAVL